MPGLVPQTAVRGRSQSAADGLARSLGYFSLVLGAAELLAPRAICRAAGLNGQEALVRSYGLREILTGVSILTSHDPTPWVVGRVAGDVLDIATVAGGRSGRSRDSNKPLALAALVAVTAIDVLCANGLKSEKGNRETAVTDYSDRSGFPQGLAKAKGAASHRIDSGARRIVSAPEHSLVPQTAS
jgi:hypothetical protein